MKKIIKSTLFLFMVFLSVESFSQTESFNYNGKTIEIDDRLIDHYGGEYVNQLKTKNPNSLLYFNYVTQHSYRIEDIGEKISSSNVQDFNLKKSTKSKALDFNPLDPSSFNFLSYGGILKTEQQVFRTGKGNDALIILSKKDLFKVFNEYKANLLK